MRSEQMFRCSPVIKMFFSGCLKILFSYVFQQFDYDALREFFSIPPSQMLPIQWASQICKFMLFTKLKKIFCSVLFSEIPIVPNLDLLIFLHNLRLFSFFLSIFSLRYSYWIISIHTFIDFSSVTSPRLLSKSNDF